MGTDNRDNKVVKRSSRRGVTTAICTLLLMVLLSGCDFYTAVYQYTPPAIQMPQFYTPPARSPIIPIHDAQLIDIGGDDAQCSDSNWFVSWTFSIVAGMITKFVGNMLRGGFVLFATMVNAGGGDPLSDGAVRGVWEILNPMAIAIIGLAIVIAGLKEAVGGMVGLNTAAIGKLLPRAIGLWLLLTPLPGEQQSTLGYAVGMGPIIADKLLAALLTAGANALGAMTNYSGVFTGSGHPCNFLALIPLAIFGLLLGVFFFLLGLIVFAQTIVLKVYTIFIPLSLAIGLIDELKPFSGQVVQGYMKTTISVVPVGVIVLLMATTVADPTNLNGDAWKITLSLLEACLYMYIAFKLMSGLLSGGAGQMLGAARGVAMTAITGGATSIARSRALSDERNEYRNIPPANRSFRVAGGGNVQVRRQADADADRDWHPVRGGAGGGRAAWSVSEHDDMVDRPTTHLGAAPSTVQLAATNSRYRGLDAGAAA